MRNKKLTLLLPSLVVVAMVILLIMGLNSKNSAKNERMQPKTIPSFELSNLYTDKPLTEALFINQQNDYKLLNVWASWCVVCKIEHPFLITLAEQGVNIVGLNYRDNQQSAISLLAKTGSPYQQVIFDGKGKLALDLGVIGTPETYLINKHGMIIARFNGVLTPKTWENIFKPLIKEITAEVQR
ncbi:DsbE family thiol:disulfide interchange protein [Psychromonas hadalis]|uniref:DsbE family thiol:disulfide interchange protein n=1 Tax=Psychromonas hadalis TaxID=211669 RepID=UPI0003B3CCEA|nr:DsbE family thiol:disulfide interchange protein [Psychromonas hadalis]